MTRKLPILPTLIVLAAVATMVALGLWQLHRAQWKEALIAQSRRALTMSSEVGYPLDGQGFDKVLYRRTTVVCARVLGIQPTAGRSQGGQSGWAQRASCALPGAVAPVTIDIGWSQSPEPARWNGGSVQGTIAPGGRIVATKGLAGLQPLATPNPEDLPNNHLAYAGQWFFFALTALAIYVLALRRKWRGV